MRKYICNAFSLQMLSEANAEISVRKITPKSIDASQYLCQPNWDQHYWAMGHADTSAVVAHHLGIPDPGPNRVNIILNEGDELIVAQLMGGRLPEGASSLPEGFTLEFYSVIIKGAK